MCLSMDNWCMHRAPLSHGCYCVKDKESVDGSIVPSLGNAAKHGASPVRNVNRLQRLRVM